MRMSIAEAVKEKLVYIGMTQNLQGHIDSRIPHVLAKCPPYGDCNLGHENCMLNNAEKEALAQGKSLMVSWAEVEISQLSLVKAALLNAFKEAHGKLPGIKGQDGKWVPGVLVVPKKRGPVSDLDWSGWYPMDDRSTASLAPKKPGVQRVRTE